MNPEEPAMTTAGAQEPAPRSALETVCNAHRKHLKEIEDDIRKMVTDPEVPPGETKAQAMLTVRHLEDARMRLGKVIQYGIGGGVSCWDSDRKPGDDGR